VDAYIGRAAAFAQPILMEVRSHVHAACPRAVETIKWGFPHFTYNGKIVCSMAAFKAHCAVGFWQRDVLKIAGSERTPMGDFGRVTRLQDLPTRRAFASLIKTAIKNIDKVTDKPVAKKGWCDAIPTAFLRRMTCYPHSSTTAQRRKSGMAFLIAIAKSTLSGSRKRSDPKPAQGASAMRCP
jgi:hypothetical protein